MRRNVRIFHTRICGLLLVVVLAATMVAAPVPVARAATTWYVLPAPDGNDANDCLTPTTACATITAAIGKAAPGDTISPAGGLYLESLTINKNIAIIGAGAA